MKKPRIMKMGEVIVIPIRRPKAEKGTSRFIVTTVGGDKISLPKGVAFGIMGMGRFHNRNHFVARESQFARVQLGPHSLGQFDSVEAKGGKYTVSYAVSPLEMIQGKRK